MPIATPALTSSIMSAGAGLGLTGQDFYRLAESVSTTAAVVFSAPATILVTATGAAGVGAVTPGAPLTGVDPNAMASLIYTQMVSLGQTGTQAYNQAMAISVGIVSALPSLILVGISPTVGVGAGVGKAVGFNNVLFVSTLITNMSALGMVGVATVPLATAIGNGICSAINATGIVPVVTIAGPAGPAPSAGVFPANFI